MTKTVKEVLSTGVIKPGSMGRIRLVENRRMQAVIIKLDEQISMMEARLATVEGDLAVINGMLKNESIP